MVKKGYKQTEIGVIPEDWAIKYLSDFGKVQGGGTPSTTMADYWGGDIAWCTPSDITSAPTKYINATERAITDLGLKNSAATVMPAGSILLCTRATIGELKINSIPMATNQGFKNIAINKGGNVDFLYYLLQTKKDRMLELAIGSTFLEISKTALCKIPLQTPMHSDEQSKIADALSDIDSLVEVLENQISKKKAIKQGAMQELLTGKCRLPGFSGEWETRTLHEISSEMVDGPFGSNLKTEHYTTERQVRIIQLSNIGEAGWNNANVKYTTFSHAAELQRCIVQPGSILIAKMMPAGRAIICPDNEKSYILGSDVVKVVPNSSVDSRYLVYATKSRFYLDQIADDTQGSTRARTSVSKLRKTAILFPEKDEQIAIADILSEMDMEIAALEGKIAKYRQIKQGMMQQLLTGKIRLKNDVEDLRQAEQANAVKTLPARTAHNRQFDDAVSIAAIVDTFYSDKYPLGRVKVQKLLYLLHRHQAVSVSDFKKKAAGPYADTVRYKGGEPIAKKNKYIVSENGKQGTRYSRGENMAQALNYVERWGMQSDLQWLKENFLHTVRNDLELFATVDMAICDLNEAGVPISVASIKDLIASSKEWKAKLSKTYFSDRDIARAIKKCTELFN